MDGRVKQRLMCGTAVKPPPMPKVLRWGESGASVITDLKSAMKKLIANSEIVIIKPSASGKTQMSSEALRSLIANGEVTLIKEMPRGNGRV